MTSKILLTGGAGYIGSHTYVSLIQAGYDVVIYDNFSNAKDDVPDRLEKITGKPVQYLKADILDAVALKAALHDHDISAVVHFAALKSVAESVSNPLTYFETNISGFTNLLNAMRDANVFTLVFSSSATVYGDPESSPIPETAQRRVSNPYGYTKLVCEQMMEQIAATDKRWVLGVLRYFNPVGAHSSGLIGEDPQNIPNNLMPYIAKVAMGELPRLNVYGNDYDTIDGTGVRDYIHVEDLARGHVLSLTKLLNDRDSHVLNMGTGRGLSVLEVVKAYETASGKTIDLSMCPRRDGDVAEYYADPSKAAKVLSFETTLDLDAMCRSSWKWVSGNQN